MSLVAVSLLTILTLAGAFAAALVPRLIHAALSLVLAFVGVAALFFVLGAEFVGLVQILIYVGAVAVLIVFTILLTQRTEEKPERINFAGLSVGVVIFLCLIWAILQTPLHATAPEMQPATVLRIGETLLHDYVWPLQCVGLILTAALIGALVLAMEEKR